MKIKAAVVYERSGSFIMEALDLDDPRNDEVIVRIVAAGICHTDLGGRDQHLPIPPDRTFPSVFGHEGAGIVERIGASVTKVKPGDHVVLSWGSCRACPACLSGHHSYCRNFFMQNFNGARQDGSPTLRKAQQTIFGNFFGQSSFADFALVNQANVVKVDKEAPLEIMAPLGCGVLTGAGAVINAFAPRPGSSIAVFGTGTVGMSAILAAVVCGCTTIVAVDINAERLDLARAMGASHAIQSGKTDPVQAIRNLTGGGIEFSLECVGNPSVLRQAVDCLGLQGVCGLLGVVAPGTPVELDMDLLMNGRTVRGIIEGNAVPELFIPKLIELQRQKRFPYDRLIKYYPLSEINQAVSDMEKGLVIKPVLRP